MAYVTQEEVEARTSYNYEDFKQAGAVMTSVQWAAYITDLIAAATALINKFCRVTSLEETTYTEYYDGKGPTGEFNAYTERDRVFHLRNRPVQSVTSVSEDVNAKTSVPSWTARTVRSVSAAGDYELLTRYGLSHIRFHNNVPAEGVSNVKVIYAAGYATGSQELDEISMIAAELVANWLTQEKQRQEAIATRNYGVRDAAEMFVPPDQRVFPKDLQERLRKYRRAAVGGAAWR